MPIDLVQRGDDEVGVRVRQQVLVISPGNAQRGHPAGLGGLNSADGVLDHEAVLRCDAELGGRGQEDLRIRFAPREVPAGEVGVEEVEQVQARPEDVVGQALRLREGVKPDAGAGRGRRSSTTRPPPRGCRPPGRPARTAAHRGTP